MTPSAVTSKKNFNLVIGRKTAKTLKEELGSGTPGMEKSMVIVGTVT